MVLCLGLESPTSKICLTAQHGDHARSAERKSDQMVPPTFIVIEPVSVVTFSWEAKKYLQFHQEKRVKSWGAELAARNQKKLRPHNWH